MFSSLKLLAEYDRIKNIYQIKVSDFFLFINVDVQFMGNVNLFFVVVVVVFVRCNVNL